MSARVSRMTGMGALATVALAVLVFGCVFAVTAGPREALAARTQALRQTIAATPTMNQTITAQATWIQFIGAFGIVNSGTVNRTMTPADIDSVTSQLRGQFNRGPVTLAPPAEDWASMTSALRPVTSRLPAVDGLVVKMEVSYRQPLAGHVRLVSGSLSPGSGTDSAASSGYQPDLSVVVTQRTARQFRLHVGSSLSVPGPVQVLTGKPATIRLIVKGVVAPASPGSAFWTSDTAVAAPSLVTSPAAPPYWVAGVFAAPGEAAATQQDFGPQGLNMGWTLPMTFGSLTANQSRPLVAALQRLSTQSPQLTGPMAAASNALLVAAGPLPALTAFGTSAGEVDALLWLLYVSLGVTAAVVLLLAARMLALRRTAELRLLRARGAAVTQIAAASGLGAAIAAVPGAALAIVAAVLAVPGQSPPGAWWPALVIVAVAISAPAAIGAWRHRLGESGRRGHRAAVRAHQGRRRRRAGARLVAEATACAAAIAGIVVFRQQGAQPGAVNPFTSATPVLVAVPVVIVVLRVYPLVLRAALKGSARGRGAASFVGLARATRTALTAALPAYALVLAVTVAAFSGMVRDAVTRGEVNASWRAAGADATISAPVAAGAVSPAAQRALAAVPGVTRSAVAAESNWTAPNGTSVTVIAVDPASYAALVSATQTWPAVNSRLLTGDSVLASPQAAAALGGPGQAKTGAAATGAATLTAGDGEPPLRVRVAGTLSGTPALTAGGAFVLVPLSALNGRPAAAPDVVLLAGSGIDTSALAAAVRKDIPGAAVTLRSQILDSLTAAPLQQGAFLLFGLAIVVAVGLGLAALLLELVLGAADRDVTLARLAAMGLETRQRTRLVLLEVLPGVLAAAVAALVAALVLPRVVAPAIDLSVFTGSGASVPLVPDVASFALPFLGLAVVTAVALTIETRTGRRSVTASLRGMTGARDAR